MMSCCSSVNMYRTSTDKEHFIRDVSNKRVSSTGHLYYDRYKRRNQQDRLNNIFILKERKDNYVLDRKYRDKQNMYYNSGYESGYNDALKNLKLG